MCPVSVTAIPAPAALALMTIGNNVTIIMTSSMNMNTRIPAVYQLSNLGGFRLKFI